MLNPATIYYLLGSAIAVGGLFVKWLSGRDREQEERFNAKLLTIATAHNKLEEKLIADIGALKATQKLLFDKADHAVSALHEYKLHVAETYVATAALEKMLHPIERRLEAIENDLRDDHRGVRS